MKTTGSRQLSVIAPSEAETTAVEVAELDLPQVFAEPRPTWLPWHIARMCFLPRFADPNKTFALDLKSLVESVAKEPGSLVYDASNPQILVIQRGNLQLKVITDIGEFAIEHVDEIAINSTMGGELRGLPEEFFSAAEESDFCFKPAFRDEGRSLLALSNTLWGLMCEGFHTSLRNGSALVFGRWRAIDADYSRVFLDQLLELEPRVYVEEANFLSQYDVKTVLRDQDSEDILVRSPYVFSDGTLLRSKGNNNEQRAKMALVVEMKDAALVVRTKDEIFADLKRRFLISRESFNKRIWPDAKRMAGYNSKQGRKPGSKQARRDRG
jgi:hypothetical protein